MAHPSIQIKADLRLTKEKLSYGTDYMKVEKSGHGSQMTLTALKHTCTGPDVTEIVQYSLFRAAVET